MVTSFGAPLPRARPSPLCRLQPLLPPPPPQPTLSPLSLFSAVPSGTGAATTILASASRSTLIAAVTTAAAFQYFPQRRAFSSSCWRPQRQKAIEVPLAKMGDGAQPDWTRLDGSLASVSEVAAVDGREAEEGIAAAVEGRGGGEVNKMDGEVVTAHEEHLPRGISETEEELRHHWFVGSIDQGTTSSRFLIFNGEGDPVASHQIEFENLYPKSGWHEHDPLELLASVEECIEGAMQKFGEMGCSKADIQSIGITNQRETTVVWDSTTGEPLYNAIVWPDTRTKTLVRDLKSRDGADTLTELCGLPLSTYPSSVKLLWLIENVDAVRQAYEDGRLAFGTVDSWLIYKLNGGTQAEKPVHVTDSTNASRTMFMNLRTLQYDDKLLGFFGIDRNKVQLPRIVPSSDSECFGSVARGALAGIRIAGCLGDQSSALVGQCGFSPGQAKNTYGTGCFLLYNVGTEPVISKYGLLATVAYDFGGGRKPVYALEGSIAVAGAGVKFLMNNLGFVDKSSEITTLAESVEDNGGVVFVTAFSGLFAPYWIDDAKGTLFGITQHTSKGHIARATLEATCYQTKAILDAMEKDSQHKLESLAVDGGLSNSDLCMQTQADITGIPVDRPAMRETTALGAAIAAGLATGVWKELSDLSRVNRAGRRVFQPQMEKSHAEKLFKKWNQAVEMSRGWVRDHSE